MEVENLNYFVTEMSVRFYCLSTATLYSRQIDDFFIQLLTLWKQIFYKN